MGIVSLGAGAEGGDIELVMSPSGPAGEAVLLAIVDAMVGLLGDAPNYVEAEVIKPGRGRFICTVRSADGATPHALREQAERRADAAAARVDAVLQLHSPVKFEGEELDLCAHCHTPPPCATVRALGADERRKD